MNASREDVGDKVFTERIHAPGMHTFRLKCCNQQLRLQLQSKCRLGETDWQKFHWQHNVSLVECLINTWSRPSSAWLDVSGRHPSDTSACTKDRLASRPKVNMRIHK